MNLNGSIPDPKVETSAVHQLVAGEYRVLNRNRGRNLGLISISTHHFHHLLKAFVIKFALGHDVLNEFSIFALEDGILVVVKSAKARLLWRVHSGHTREAPSESAKPFCSQVHSGRFRRCRPISVALFVAFRVFPARSAFIS